MKTALMPDITDKHNPWDFSTPRKLQALGTRNLAVLFVDVAGSTALYETLGDMRAHAAISAALREMAVAVLSCGGRIVKTVGDELMCTFQGADDAARGAIAIQLALARNSGPDAERIAVRVGVNFGPVVESEGDVFGDSVNVAARLVGMARPSQILTTGDCVEQMSAAHRDKARELQLIGVRGRSNYVPVWELMWRVEEQITQRAARPMLRGREASVLRIEFGGQDWELAREGDVVTLGRDETSHIVLTGTLSSRYHARIVVRNGKFILIDQSTNGTYVHPEGGETMALMREECALTGAGSITLGRSGPSRTADTLRYSTRPSGSPSPVGA